MGNDQYIYIDSSLSMDDVHTILRAAGIEVTRMPATGLCVARRPRVGDASALRYAGAALIHK